MNFQWIKCDNMSDHMQLPLEPQRAYTHTHTSYADVLTMSCKHTLMCETGGYPLRCSALSSFLNNYLSFLSALYPDTATAGDEEELLQKPRL